MKVLEKLEFNCCTTEVDYVQTYASYSPLAIYPCEAVARLNNI
jgi:hypothetical protein